MRTDELFLSDMIEACDAIMAFLGDQDREDFLTNDLVQSAVLYQFVIVGEAANRVAVELRDRHPAIAWRSAVGLRDYAAHGYFAIVLPRIWETAKQDVPLLRWQIAEVLATEFPEREERVT